MVRTSSHYNVAVASTRALFISQLSWNRMHCLCLPTMIIMMITNFLYRGMKSDC